MQFSTSKTVTDCLNKKHKLRCAKLALRGEDWDNLSEAEKDGIEAALQQLNDGESMYHTTVISQAREKYEN